MNLDLTMEIGDGSVTMAMYLSERRQLMNKKERIEAFEYVRDIPYSVPLNPDDEDNACTGKSARLSKIFRREGYETRWRVCEFKWNLKTLPKKVIAVPHTVEAYHVYLEVNIDGKWVAIDATWDSGLASKFHINEWDGESDTALAVVPTNICSPEESEQIMATFSRRFLLEWLEPNRGFFKALNEWFEAIRQESQASEK